MGVSWDPKARVATLRMYGLRVWATDGRLVAWNPLHQGVVFERHRDGETIDAMFAQSLPMVMFPPLAAALGQGNEIVVGEALGIEWNDGPDALGSTANGVIRVEANLRDDEPWVSTIGIEVGQSVEHRLRITPGRGAVALPADLDGRERVESVDQLWGRVGDVMIGERMPLVWLGVVGAEGADRSSWSIGSAFSSDGRVPSALVLLVTDVSDERALASIALVREARRTLARRAVAAGLPAELFPGVLARPVFTVEPASYDAEMLAEAAEAWRGLPAQPAFDEAESGTPKAMWGPRAELLERVAPDANHAVIVVSRFGRLEAVLPLDDGTAAIAELIADAIAPELIPVVFDD